MSSVIKLVIAMCIWGSLGVFVKNISLESFEIAFLRATIASAFVGGVFFINSKKTLKTIQKEYKDNKANNLKYMLILILSGVLIGFNWVLLFKSYEYTTVSNGTLSYYFAPVIVVFLSPIVLKEKFTLKTGISVICAMFGLYLILNTSSSSLIDTNYNHTKGILMGLSAASLYATVMLLNRYIQVFSDYKRTFIQLISASFVLLPFIIYRDKLVINDMKTLILIIVLGIIHTGVAYLLYFSSIKEIKSQTTALLSYIDPVSSIFFSVVFLQEALSINQVIGGSIILISAYIAQKPPKKNLELEIENI